MQFWRLYHPEYASDYADTFLNGHLEHPFALPGVRCEQCGATWGGHCVLPYELPANLHSMEPLRRRWPISGHAHAELRSTVLNALQAAGVSITKLPVGAVFQPAYLDVPSRPEADFLWSGIGSVVVSKRIRDAFIQAGFRGAVPIPVFPRRIGKRSAKLAPPIPISGEPEDLITEILHTVPRSQAPPYFELVITAESRHPLGAQPHSICELCGREDFESSPRELVMRPEIWNGDDIFLLATTLWVVVTDSVKILLESMNPTNVVFLPMTRAA